MSLDKEGQERGYFFQGSPSRCADFEFFPDTDIANLSGLTAAEAGFLVVKPFKKHSPSLPVTQMEDKLLVPWHLEHPFHGLVGTNPCLLWYLYHRGFIFKGT